MEVVKNRSASVEDTCGGYDVPNSLYPMNQHTKELNEKNDEEENDEHKVDGVKGNIGGVWYHSCFIEWHCKDRLSVLTEYPVKGECRGIQGRKLHQEYPRAQAEFKNRNRRNTSDLRDL